jgi:hypothetical protein
LRGGWIRVAKIHRNGRRLVFARQESWNVGGGGAQWQRPTQTVDQFVVERNVLHPMTILSRRIKSRRPSEGDWGEIHARYRRRYAHRALLGAVVGVIAGWLIFTKGAPPTQSDIDAQALRAPKTVQPFQPTHPIDPHILSTIDAAKVHRQLLPAWIISLQHNPHSIGRRNAEDAFGMLRDEAGKDPNLAGLLDRLHEKLMDGTYDFQGEIQALIKGWNGYLARGGVPFRIEYRIERTQRGPELRIRCYRVIADVPVSVAHSEQHVLLLARQDQTNLVEAFLGQTATDRGAALVITDRIAEFAIDRLWPLFEAHDETSELELLGKVRHEARLALDKSVAEPLTRSFSIHRALETELASLARRRGCGAGVLIERVPWNGLSDPALAMVNRVAQKNERRHCQRVTPTDADRIRAISQQLREHPDLAQALGSLAGWLAKAVVVHEARHLADETLAPEAGAVRLCPGCPESFDYRARAEVSAYLASFETVGVGYVALLQACGNEADGRGSSSTALGFLLPRLLVKGCAGPMPDDLYARAAATRVQLLGRDDSIGLPTDFPAAIPIPR